MGLVSEGLLEMQDAAQLMAPCGDYRNLVWHLWLTDEDTEAVRLHLKSLPLKRILDQHVAASTFFSYLATRGWDPDIQGWGPFGE